MKKISLTKSLYAICLMAFVAFLVRAYAATYPGTPSELTASISSIESMCKTKLGIGIAELGLLAQAKRGSVFSESGLRNEDRIDALDNLSAQGYIKVFRRPAGQETWIEFIPTEKGQVIVDYLNKEAK